MNHKIQQKKQGNLLRNQLTTAVLMLVLGAGTYAYADSYTPRQTILKEAEIEKVPEPETVSFPPETETEPEEVFRPSLNELNLAHFFPEGADESDVTNSLAGEAFRVLASHDEDYISNLYTYSDIKPETLAARLGIARSQVMGKYNPKDENHDPKNPDSWTVGFFKNLRLSATDGDGNPISPYSNVIEIMSMANAYTCNQNPEDLELFLSYAKQLWEQSHSYTVRISDVYYCDGCLNEEEKLRRLAELEAEGIIAENEENLDEIEAELETSEEETASETASQETESGHAPVIAAGTAEKKREPEPETKITERVPESTSGVIMAGGGASAGRFYSSEPDETTADSADSQKEPEDSASLEAAAKEAGQPEDEAKLEENETPAVPIPKATPSNAADSSGYCSGHVDLIVNMKIIGMKEQKNLFVIDSVGNDPEKITEGGWQGWNEETIASARSLAERDWFETYGLSVSTIASGTPLTEGEIKAYMAELPPDLSKTRRSIIRFALESVGKVPYYWGGKPAAAGYQGNQFNMPTTPDEQGRMLKGLDCSGWINWVYWSATGKRLPYEGTSGLAACGKPIKRSELQAGDIIVRTGSNAHVIMFLGWTADGRILCIHESSDRVNNATVSVRDANWPYYRKLVE